MGRLYKVLNKKDCAELGITYTPTEKVILSEHNIGHYTITRYASTLGKVCLVLLFPVIALRYIASGMYECICAIHDSFNLCDRHEIYGDSNEYINFLKKDY